jgi:hypothetical protein
MTRVLLTTVACLALLRTAVGADSPGPGAAQAAPEISAQDAQADALLHQGRVSLKQRLKSSGQEAQTELDKSEREYQHTADELEAIRTQELLGSVLPGVIEGSVKGSRPGLVATKSGATVAYVPGSGGQSSGASGSASARYLTPLATSCVRRYWDSQVYNWLSFENDCGQAIYLTFIFAHPVGWAMSGSMHLSPGAHSNTGRSSSDINQAGGYDLYVCPANSIPVDLNGNTFNANVTEFLCKPQ